MPTLSPLLDLYSEVLDCARAQCEAVRKEEWTTFNALTSRREHLMAQSEAACAANLEEDAQPLIDVIRIVAATDAAAEEALEVQRAELQEEIGRFRQEFAMTAAYRPGQAVEAGHFLIDLFR